ncbi:MAG: hypothetical protein ACYTJ0_21380 [Planctomycetota bacterium]|jgi:hypothetical protein
MDETPNRYLTVVRWPEGWNRHDVAARIAEAIGTDSSTVLVRLGAPPRIFASLPPDAAARAVIALQESGGDAFTCSIPELEALGSTLKIRDLRLDSGRLAVELWRTEGTTLIEPRTIDVVVRACLSDEVSRRRTAAPTPSDPIGDQFHVGWAIGGAYGMAARLRAAELFRDLTARDRQVEVSHKLDLHVADGRVFQIDGDKFGFGVLGDLRGPSDNVNVDRMCELVTHLSPDVVVDPYFELWKPPAGHDRLRLPMMRLHDEDVAFAFYSRWAALMYRHVLGAA